MVEQAVVEANWTLIPDHLHAELEGWLCFGTMPRSRFLLAVLANDLLAADMVASDDEFRRLIDIVRFLNEDAPGFAHGSLGKVLLWEFLGGLAGRDHELAGAL